MDQLQPANQDTYDPLRRFPYDVWTTCIKFAMTGSSAGPLPYLAVSAHWGRNLIEEPSLWTTIIIEEGEDEAARTHIFAHLSQNCLLDIIYRRSRDTLCHILENNAHRIRSISVDDREVWINWDQRLSSVLAGIDYLLSSLQVLYTGQQPIPNHFAPYCPKITSILSGISIRNHDLPLSNIREAYFIDVQAKHISKISQQSKYRTLGINFSLPSLNHALADNYMYTFDFKSWLKGLTLLSPYQSSCLESLSMTIPSNIFSALFLQVSLLHRLRTLVLRIMMGAQEEAIVPITMEGMKSVRTLDIRFIAHSSSDANEKVLRMMLEAFTKERALQYVECISLSSTEVSFSDNQLGTCLQSAINAKEIMVNAAPLLVSSEITISDSSPLTKLESLTLSRSALLILDYINASQPIALKWKGYRHPYLLPRRKKFDFQVARLEDMHNILKKMDPVVQEQLLHRCHTILFGGKFKPHSIFEFDMLVDVDISPRKWTRKRQTITRDFLGVLLQHSKAIPHLHTIRMDKYPFWELLFTVMRQRLVGNTHPIKRLVLPGLPCAYLMSHLVRLLSGDSSMSTARDVDMIILRRHSDPVFYACTFCTDAGYMYCDRPDTYMTDSDATEDDEDGDSSDDDVRDTFSRGSPILDFLPDDQNNCGYIWDGWKGITYSKRKTVSCCPRHRIGDGRINITEHTFAIAPLSEKSGEGLQDTLEDA